MIRDRFAIEIENATESAHESDSITTWDGLTIIDPLCWRLILPYPTVRSIVYWKALVPISTCLSSIMVWDRFGTNEQAAKSSKKAA